MFGGVSFALVNHNLYAPPPSMKFPRADWAQVSNCLGGGRFVPERRCRPHALERILQTMNLQAPECIYEGEATEIATHRDLLIIRTAVIGVVLYPA